MASRITPPTPVTVYLRMLSLHDGEMPLTLGTKDGKIVTQELIANGADPISPALPDQLWHLHIISDDGKTGKCYFKHYSNPQEFIGRPEKAKKGDALEIVIVPDSNTIPERVIWDCRVLPNWYDDDLGAPRPIQITAPADNNEKKSVTWEALTKPKKNGDMITLQHLEKDYWDSEKMQNQIWYFEPPRVEIVKRPTLATLMLTITIHRNEVVELWKQLIGGDKPFRTVTFPPDHPGDHYQVPVPVNIPEDKFYISGRRQATPTSPFINESANNPFPVNTLSTKIKFFYGDPHGGVDIEIEEGS